MGGGVEFAKYKRQMIKAAEELFYGDDVIKRIKNARTEKEISEIMRRARVNGEEKELKESWIDRVKIMPCGRE